MGHSISAQAMHLLQHIQCGAEIVSSTLCTKVTAVICKCCNIYSVHFAHGLLPMVLKRTQRMHSLLDIPPGHSACGLHVRLS